MQLAGASGGPWVDAQGRGPSQAPLYFLVCLCLQLLPQLPGASSQGTRSPPASPSGMPVPPTWRPSARGRLPSPRHSQDWDLSDWSPHLGPLRLPCSPAPPRTRASGLHECSLLPPRVPTSQPGPRLQSLTAGHDVGTPPLSSLPCPSVLMPHTPNSHPLPTPGHLAPLSHITPPREPRVLCPSPASSGKTSRLCLALCPPHGEGRPPASSGLWITCPWSPHQSATATPQVPEAS